MTALTTPPSSERIYRFGQFIEKTVFIVVIFGIGILGSTYLLNIEVANRDFLFLLSGLVATYTLLYHQFVYSRNPTINVAFIDALVYATFIFLLNHATGGLQSPLFFLYLLPIISVRLNLGSKLPLAITFFISILIFLELLLTVNPNPSSVNIFLSSFEPDAIYSAATDILSILLVGLYIRSISIELSHENEQLTQIGKLNEELKRVDRGKDEFIQIASHEIRTPLTALRGGLAVLMAGNVGKLTRDQQDFVGKLSEAADRLSAVAEDSLNISALEKHRLNLKISPFDLPALSARIISEMQTEAESKKVKLVLTERPHTLPKALGDEARIETVIRNLVSNGVKFTPSGGSVTLSIRSSGGKIITSVKDTGVGIPPEEVHNLFRKFYRVENVLNESTQGTGLGLYIVKLIMALHGETVGVESELGQGSTFSFTLKAAPHG